MIRDPRCIKEHNPVQQVVNIFQEHIHDRVATSAAQQLWDGSDGGVSVAELAEAVVVAAVRQGQQLEEQQGKSTRL